MNEDYREHGVVLVQWRASPNEQRVIDDLVAAARQLGLLGPDHLDVTTRVGVLRIDGAPFDVAMSSLETAKRLWENLVATYGEDVAIGADVRPTAPRGRDIVDAELHALVRSSEPGLVVLGRALVDRLPEDAVRDLALRAGTYVFPRPSHYLERGFRDPPRRLPRRFVRQGDDALEDGLDAHGLLVPSDVRGARPLEDILYAARTLMIVAEPWMGKTYCARAIYEHLRALNGTEGAFLLDLRATPRDLRTDPDFQAWRVSEREATLLVDGADEAQFQRVELREALSALERLDDAEHARLRVILFTRDDATQNDARRALVQARSRSRLGQLPCFRLLPIDADEAKRAVGADGLARARSAAEQLGNALPRPLSVELLRVLADPLVSPTTAQDEVARRICREGVPDELYARVADDLLWLAQRAAAVLALTGTRAADLGTSGLFGPMLAAAKVEALDALLRSRALIATPDGHQFRSRHTQELLAARALKAVKPAAKAAMRELLTDSSGRLCNDVDEIADEIARLDERWAKAIAEWRIEAPLPSLPVQQATALLDALIEMDQPMLPFGVSRVHLARIDHPSVRARALAVLKDDARPVRVRELLLDLASALSWRDPPVFADQAVSLALDRTAPPRLRLHAAYVVRALGREELVEHLRPLITESGDDDVEQLRALVIDFLLEDRRLSVLEAAAHAPQEREGLTDSRSSALRRIARALEVPDARAVLARYSGRAPNADPTIDPPILAELAPAALERLETEKIAWDPALAADVAFLWRKTQLSMERDVDRLVEARLERDPAARRVLYPLLIDEHLHHDVRRWLRNEDAGWLLGLARDRERLPERLAEDLNHLLWWLRDDAPALVEITALLRERVPERWAEWELARQRAPELRAQWEEDRRRDEDRDPAPRRVLGDVIDDVRGNVPEATRRLRLLASLCFGGDAPSYTNVDGSFYRLPRERREEIIGEVRTILLPRAEASRVPEPGESFFSSVTEDADAFVAAVTWDDDMRWLSTDIVLARLPLVLFSPENDATTEVVRRCLVAYPLAVVDVATQMVHRELRAGRYPFAARAFPSELWRQRAIAALVAAVVADETFAIEARAPLLRLYVAHGEVHDAMPLLRRLVARDGDIALAALSCLLVRDPDEGAAHLERLVRDIPTAAAAFYDLRERHSELRMGTQADLTPSALEAVVCTLARVVTWTDPRPKGSYSPTDEHELYELRSDLLVRLAPLPEFDVQRLLSLVPDERRTVIRAWLQHLRDTREIERLLAQLVPATARPDAARVIDVLDGTRTAKMRSIDDLFTLIVDELNADADAREDIEMVSRGGKKRRSWNHEPSLQAYVGRRIRELLRRTIPHEHDVLHREVQENAGAERPDFLLVRVIPGSTGDGPMEVPVEVKWSHARACLPELIDKLGKRYVVEKKRTRGIYVVGFTGTVRNKDLVKLKTALEQQGASFEKEHPEARLGIVILRFVGA